MSRASAATILAALFLACGSTSTAPAKCANGQSVCLPPVAGAASFCADLASDVKNCGLCNLACPPVSGSTSVACSKGACQADCGGGFASTTKIVCGARTASDGGLTLACTDTASDHENCGACGNVCTGTQQCQSGKCTSVSGSAACGGSGTGTTYANLQTDRANCGVCGNACAANETCSDGACNPCPVAQCSNVCVDTQHDPKNCGTCGNVVPNCENGVALAKITIDRNSPLFNPGVVGAPGLFPVSVKVHSQLRVVRVTATVGTTVTDLQLNGPAEQDPNIWSGNITVPGTSQVVIVFDAFDELYVPRALDAGIIDQVHSDEQTTTATVLPLPTAAATPLAPTVQAQTVPPVPVGPVFKWVPLNGPVLQFSVSVPTGQNIATVELRENNLVFGTAAVNGNGTAVFSALPAQVGLGDLSITACPFDLAGQAGPCSPATTFTVGRIGPLTAPAVIGKNADANGSHTIYYVASNPQFLFQQDFAQLNSTASGQPGAQVGGAAYFVDSLHPVPEGTGVYAVKADATGVDRVDGPTLLKTNFVTPPAAGPGIAGIDLVTPGSLVLCGVATTPNAPTYFATAAAAQTTAAAVPAGIYLGPGNSNRNGQACPAASLTSVFPGGSALQTTQSGAIAGWFNNAGDVRPLLFHPALTAANHLMPLIAAPVANATARDLQTFPGGEIVFQFVDSTTNTAYLGAAYFDGTNQPVLLPPVPIGAVGGAIIGGSFIVAKPGVIVGVVPAATAGRQVIEIVFSGGAAQVFSPAPSNGTTAGPVVDSAIATRSGGFGTFAISDDRTKALFRTDDQSAGAPDAVARLHLLDLATGTDTPIGGAPRNSFTHRPHFVRSAPVYTGGAPAGAHQYVVFTQLLPRAPGQTTSHERISFANFQGAVTTVDRLNSYAAVNSQVDSAAGGVILFLSLNDQGGADLYSVPLASPPGPVAATKVMDHVFWFKTREDKKRLLVARSDGTLYIAPLAVGTNLSQALVPLVNAGFLGDAPILTGGGLGTFGFTPDGDHAYVLRDAFSTGNFGQSTTTGIVETIDFTTGAFGRTDFGRVIASNNGSNGQPIIGFVGGATTAVLLDQLSVEARNIRLAVAPPGATTSRVDTGALPPGYQFNNDSATFFSSLDNNEGLLIYQLGAFGGGPLGATPAPAAAFAGGEAIRLQKDGSFDVLPSGSNSGLQQRATFSPFGAPFLPDWSIVNDFDVTAESLFKVWGGAAPLPFINVSRNFQAQTDPRGTVITPGFNELLYSFDDGNPGNGYVMALPLPGRAPPAPLFP